MSTIIADLSTEEIALPEPALRAHPAALDQLLMNRRSTRVFAADPLSQQHLSALLWSAFGINRRDSGGRTAPSAHNWQEMEIFAVLPHGAYRYECGPHRLCRVSAADLRALTGTQDFAAHVPLNLVYVADVSRMTDANPDEIHFFSGADAAFIAQNVYLCCAALGLATVVRGLIDRKRLASALGLSINQRVALAQSVGHFPEGR